jgi:hypothetical protein
VWSGKPTHKNDHNRSIALARLEPLLSIDGVQFISLQREYRDSDMEALSRLPIRRLEEFLVDFADTAAAIGELDLVIAVDSAVAHLAGAMAKPLWLLIPHIQDWRWLRGRSDSPWYPTARLFRQTQPGDWDEVIAILANELAGFSAHLRHGVRDMMQVNFPPDWASIPTSWPHDPKSRPRGRPLDSIC